MLESTQIRSVNFPNCPPFVSRNRMDQPVKFAKVAFMDHAGGPTSVVRVAHKPSHNYSCTVFGAAMEFRNEVQLGRLIVHILPGFSVERKHVGAGGDLYGLCAGAKHSANLRQTYAETVSSELNSYQDQFLSWDIIADYPRGWHLRWLGLSLSVTIDHGFGVQRRNWPVWNQMRTRQSLSGVLLSEGMKKVQSWHYGNVGLPPLNLGRRKGDGKHVGGMTLQAKHRKLVVAEILRPSGKFVDNSGFGNLCDVKHVKEKEAWKVFSHRRGRYGSRRCLEVCPDGNGGRQRASRYAELHGV